MILDLEYYKKNNFVRDLFKYLVARNSVDPWESKKQDNQTLPLLTLNKCVSCGLCAHCCPTQSIKLDGDLGQIPRIFNILEVSCVCCQMCIEICPKEALESSPSI